MVVKWFRRDHESHLTEALLINGRLRRGLVTVVVPTLLFLELLNAAARRWRWDAAALRNLVHEIEELPLLIAEPSRMGIARWASLGLSAYDASYVALAEERSVQLVTTDDQIIDVAPAIARHLRDYV